MAQSESDKLSHCFSSSPIASGIFLMAFLVVMVFFGAADGQEKETALDPLVDVLQQINDPVVQLDILRGIHKAVEGRRKLTMPRKWPAVYRLLEKSPNAEVREKATILAVLFGDPRALMSLRNIVIDKTGKQADRESALQALLQKLDPSLLKLLQQLLDDSVMRGPAIRGLAAFNDKTTPEQILKQYSLLSESEKHDAVNTLASRPSYALALLDAVGEKTVSRSDLSAYTIRQLTTLDNKQVNERIEEVWGSIRPTSKDRAAAIAEYKSFLTPKYLQSADRSHGRLLYKKTCASCHKLFGEGRKVGPDLTGSQRANLDYVLQNLLDPNAIVGRDFRVTVIVTEAGRIITGIISSENDNGVAVETPNERIIIPLDEIEVRKQSRQSMMPDGMLPKMSREDVRDLIAYLGSPNQVPLPEQENDGDSEASDTRNSP